MAPKFWQIKRKGYPFILSVSPGPYAKDRCYPIGVLLRDVLHLCHNLHEAKIIMNSGQIKGGWCNKKRCTFWCWNHGYC